MAVLLQINVTANWGSHGRIAENIGELAMEHGWESHIAYGRYANKSKSEIYKIGSAIDIYNHVLQTRVFDRHGLASKQATRRLMEYIDSVAPDIIHLHNIHGYYLNYPLLFEYLQKSEIPVVWTLHDCWAFTGHCAYFDYINCDRWKFHCHHCPALSQYPHSSLFDRSSDNFNDKCKWFTSLKNMTIVPVSDWLASKVRQSFLSRYPIQVIHNGVDTSTFNYQSVKKEDFGFQDKFIVLGVASVWDDRKGLADFLKLRNVLPEEYAIILIGLTNKQIKKLPQGILGISRTNRVKELAEYYSLADVYVNPTWEDNFPTTNLEAQACGTPVITYRTGGSIEAIYKGTGYIVEQGDIPAIVSIITKIKGTGKIPYMHTCRDHIVKNFEKSNTYQQYLYLYNTILGIYRI